MQRSDEVRPFIEKQLAAGTVLFWAGDPSDAVAMIIDGEVEVLAEQVNGLVRIGKHSNGAYVGDKDVLAERPRRFTFRTTRPTRVEMLSGRLFLERLRASREADGPRAEATVRIMPASTVIAGLLPEGGLQVTSFPFSVGRGGSDGDDDKAAYRLVIDETPPYRLSRRHFSILREGDTILLVDPGSRLGTLVDGERLGIEPLALSPGMHEIVAGGASSPYRFQLAVD
ncbi:MAG: cyclic nucleotide-binding domain-containing protein [Geminicoccaceae bacterium]